MKQSWEHDLVHGVVLERMLVSLAVRYQAMAEGNISPSHSPWYGLKQQAWIQ